MLPTPKSSPRRDLRRYAPQKIYRSIGFVRIPGRAYRRSGPQRHRPLRIGGEGKMYPPAVFQNVRLKQRLFIEGEQLLALRLLFLLLAPGLTRRRTFRRRLFAPGTWFDHLHRSFTLRSIPSGIVRQLLRGRQASSGYEPGAPILRPPLQPHFPRQPPGPPHSP